MGLTKKGDYWYGESQADIRTELARVGTIRELVPTKFADARCTCGNGTFRLQTDETAGVAIRTCASCGLVHPIGDSAQYLDDAEDLGDHVCICDAEALEITVGLALYDDGSDDVHWLYLGCRCPACGVTGNYADWKNEYIGYQGLLALV